MIQAGLLLIKATLIVSAALVACRLMRRRRAAVRHAVMASAFGVLLVLPIASLVGPSINLEIPVEPARIAVPPSVPTSAMADNPLPLEADSAALVGSSMMPSSAVSTAAVVWVVWAIGALLCLLPMLAGSWRMRSLRRCGRRWPLGDRLMRGVVADAGIRRRVDVLLHEGITSPVTYGALRPVIALPLDAEAWTKQELEWAIVHELEHVRRADWLTQCLARAVCAAYWFHPLVLMAWHRLVLDAERACDDAVLRLAEPTAYADQLVVMAARGSSGPGRPMLAMAGHDDLSVRVRAILDSVQQRGRAGAACMALTASTALLAVAAVAPLQAVSVPRAAPAVLVSALPADPVRVAANVSETTVTRDARELLAVGQTLVRRSVHRVRLKPEATAQGRVPLKRDATVPDATALASNRTAIVDRTKDESPAFVAAAHAQVAQADAAAVGRQMWILLFDLTSLQPDAVGAVAEQSRRWVDQTSLTSAMVAIVTVGTKITVVSEFTSSREELLAALQSPALLSEAAAGGGTLTGARIADTPPEPLNDLRIRALTVVCNAVAPIKDRKRLLYFTTGLRSSVAEVLATTDACSRANVLIYQVDPRGLVNIPNPDPNGQGGTLFRGR